MMGLYVRVEGRSLVGATPEATSSLVGAAPASRQKDMQSDLSRVITALVWSSLALGVAFELSLAYVIHSSGDPDGELVNPRNVTHWTLSGFVVIGAVVACAMRHRVRDRLGAATFASIMLAAHLFVSLLFFATLDINLVGAPVTAVAASAITHALTFAAMVATWRLATREIAAHGPTGLGPATSQEHLGSRREQQPQTRRKTAE